MLQHFPTIQVQLSEVINQIGKNICNTIVGHLSKVVSLFYKNTTNDCFRFCLTKPTKFQIDCIHFEESIVQVKDIIENFVLKNSCVVVNRPFSNCINLT